MTAYQPTDLDYKGAVTWVQCPMCLVDQNVECASMFMLGMFLTVAAVKPGNVHELRMKKWLELKARVAATTASYRKPNMQQLPRSEPYKISEGGSEEAKLYWENRSKIPPGNKR